MAMVVPAKGDEEKVAKLLLGLADNVHDVQSTMDGPAGVAFVVPDYLAEKYDKASDQSDDVLSAESDDEAESPAPKKRGRPKGSTNAKAKE